MKPDLMKEAITIENLYDSMSARLYNVSMRITGSCNDAEEIMHDSLLQYWRCRKKGDIKDLKGWLTSVCIRKSIDKLRERHRRNLFLESYEDPVLEEEHETEPEYDIPDILEALSALPDHYRSVISLHLLEGYEYQEISEMTETTESTVRSLYMRGRQKLAATLKKRQP